MSGISAWTVSGRRTAHCATQPLTQAKMNAKTMIITPVTTAMTRAYQRRMSSLLSDDIEKFRMKHGDRDLQLAEGLLAYVHHRHGPTDEVLAPPDVGEMPRNY